MSPIAPGTCGALLGVLIHFGVAFLVPTQFRQLSLIAAFLSTCMLTILLTHWAEDHWKEEDPKNFVLDEVAGYLMIPIFFSAGTFVEIAVGGFFLFRVFDIIKIPPARQIDRNMHGGWGVLLDDLVSSGYALGVLYFMVWLSATMKWNLFVAH